MNGRNNYYDQEHRGKQWAIRFRLNRRIFGKSDWVWRHIEINRVADPWDFKAYRWCWRFM